MHDRNGHAVKVGDTVWIQATIEAVQAVPDYCNCTVRLVVPMPPYEKGDVVTLNTKSVQLDPTTHYEGNVTRAADRGGTKEVERA